MTIQFHIRGLRDEAPLRRQLESDLKRLHGEVPVNSAQVVLVHQREAVLPYQAVAMLQVAGPDVHAAARDHTWTAAWQKVLSRLREQLEQRRGGRTARPPGPDPVRRRKT